MRKSLQSVALILSASFMMAQTAPAIEFDKIYGGSDYELGNRIEKTADGGYIIAGIAASIDGDVTGNHADDPSWLTHDIWLVKLDEKFNIMWEKCLGGTMYEDLKDMKVTPDGGYIVVGYTDSYDGDVTGNHGNPNDYYGDGWAVKVDVDGNIEWTRALGGLIADQINSVAVTPEGDYILVGLTESTNGDVITPIYGHKDIWVVKMNDEGEILSSRTYGGTSYDEALSVDVFENGNYIVAAQTYSNDGDINEFYGTPGMDSDIWLVEFNPEGEIVWQNTYGGGNMDKAHKVLITPDNGILVGGYAGSENGNINIPNNTGSLDFWVLKLDSERNLEWQYKYGGSGNDNLFNMTIAEDGYVLMGATNSTDLGEGAEFQGVYDQLIMKVNFDGELQWMKTLGGSDNESAEAIVIDEDGSYVIAGYTQSTDGDVSEYYGLGDVWLVKLEAEKIMALNDSNLSSVKVYPNPAKDFISISNHKDISKVSLVDLAGKNVLSKSVNAKSVKLNISHLPNGIYILKVESNGKEKTFKVIKK